MIEKFLELLMESVDGVESSREMMIRIIISVALFLATVLFRNQISKFLVLVVNKIAFRNNKKAQNQIMDCLKKPVSFFVCVLALYAAAEIVAPAGEIRKPILLLVKLGFILFSAWSCISLINSDYSFVLNDETTKTKKTAVKFISNIIKGAIAVIALLMVLEQFGISATKLFAALGIGGVAVAFACKDAVENMISGFIIIFDNPFDVEDVIEIDGQTGTVEDIKIRTTRIRAVDGTEKVFPNTTMANASITNWSRMNKRAVEQTMTICYEQTTEEISDFCEKLREIILSNDAVIEDSLRVNFTDFSQSSLDIKVFFYVTAVGIADYQRVKNDINLAIKNYVDSSSISFAYDTQTVYLANKK